MDQLTISKKDTLFCIEQQSCAITRGCKALLCKDQETDLLSLHNKVVQRQVALLVNQLTSIKMRIESTAALCALYTIRASLLQRKERQGVALCTTKLCNVKLRLTLHIFDMQCKTLFCNKVAQSKAKPYGKK